MLGLILIGCICGIVFSAFRYKKKHKICSKIILIVCAIIVLCTYGFGIIMFYVIEQNDAGYYQKQIVTLVEVNRQMENLIETTKTELSDNHELLNYVEQYLKEEISYNNAEISNCKTLQEKVDLYRWLLFFK